MKDFRSTSALFPTQRETRNESQQSLIFKLAPSSQQIDKMSRRIHTAPSPDSSVPDSSDSRHQYLEHLSPRHEKKANLLVTALAVPVFLMAVFIFKIHFVDLPQIEANHYPPKNNHPHASKNSMTRHLEKIRKQAKAWREEGPKEDDDGSRNITVRTEGDPERIPIYNILEQAGFDTLNDPRFNDDLIKSLPKWSEVKEMYGEPKILGLDTCQYYRESVDKKKWKLAVAGNFNSGTNFLYELLRKNCQKPPLWQVPW